MSRFDSRFSGRFGPRWKGRFGGGVAAGGIEEEVGITLAFRASARSTAETITVPASAEAGDLALLVDYAVSSAVEAPAEVIPTDFTEIASAAAESVRSRSVVSYKILNGTEAGNAITGMNGDSSNSKVMFVFSGGITSVTPSTFNVEQTGGDPAEQIVLAGAGTVPLIVIAAAASNATGSDFTTETPAFDATLTDADLPDDRLIVGYSVYQSSPQNHTVDVADIAARNYLTSGYIEVA